MSSRAIRAIRGNNHDALADIPQTVLEDDDDDDGDSNEEEESPPRRSTAFAAMMGSDSEDDNDSSSDESVANVNKDNLKSTEQTKEDAKEVLPEPEKEEDLDALLSEFCVNGLSDQHSRMVTATNETSRFDIILQEFDTRDLDYDFSMRNSLLSGNSSTTTHASRKQSAWFGGVILDRVRPPRLVGGGMGMTTYDRDPRPIPPPYNSDEFKQQWCTFVYSDTYERDLRDYSYIEQSGDLNALVMFVAHHPFVSPALLQLSTVLYQTNHSAEGLALLRRCLLVYESSSLVTFLNSVSNGTAFFADKDQKENSALFEALFKLVQVCYIAGLSRTCLAVSRLLLSLDPLRDPMNILLCLDFHAISVGACSNDGTKTLTWLVDLVESDVIQLVYRDSVETHQGGLRSLPNWAYSYALALFQLHKLGEYREVDSDESEPCIDFLQKANDAIRDAMSQFPDVVGLLLQKLEIDTTGRSFQRDWSPGLDFMSNRSRELTRSWFATAQDSIAMSATVQACELVSKMYVQQNSKLWENETVLQWMYDNLLRLLANTDDLPGSPSPAVMRYANAKLEDFEDRIQTMPPDANIIDPGMIAHAMNIEVNRPRFLRHAQQQRNWQFGQEGQDFGADGNALAQQRLLGPPTHVVNPDWPMMEVFWRSFLPWNHVDGIPPPRR